MITSPKITALGAVLMALAVALGAFGAHALPKLTPLDATYATSLWQTATLYFLVHGLGVMGVGILTHLRLGTLLPAYLMTAGCLLFCGSLYALALGFPKILGAVAPIGGTLFVASWLCLAWQLTRSF